MPQSSSSGSSGPSGSRKTVRPPFYWVAATICFGMVGLYMFSAAVFVKYTPYAVDLGWGWQYSNSQWYVSSIDPENASASNLKEGDLILAVNGDMRAATISPEMFLRGAKPGTPIVVTVERAGQRLDVPVPVPAEIDWQAIAYHVLVYFVSLAFFGQALLLGLLRPDQRLARIGFAAFMLSALGFLTGALELMRPHFVGLERAADSLVTIPLAFGFAFVYHFYRDFPRGTDPGGIWRWLTYFFYVSAIVFTYPNHLLFRFFIAPPQERVVEFVSQNFDGFLVYAILYTAYISLALIASFAVLIRNFRRVDDVDERRRLRWVVIGTTASVLPYGALHLSGLLAVIFGYEQVLTSNAYFLMVQLGTSLFILIPITFGYTIFRHRIFDINVAVRLGFRYLLARGVLEALLSLPLVGLALSIYQNPNMTVAELLFQRTGYFYLLVAVVLSLMFRSRLGDWVDRQFFRDAYDREKILFALIDDLKQKDSVSEITWRVSREIENALHPKHLVILYRQEDSGSLVRAYSSGSGMLDFRMPEDAYLLRLLDGETAARDVRDLTGDLPQEERDRLERYGIVLIVPLTGPAKRLVGLLLLGEKRSEEPYSARDRQLLEPIASQMAIVHENAQLKSRVARDEQLRVDVLGRIEKDGVNLVKECPACGACHDSTVQFCPRDGTLLTMSMPIERIVDGKYRLDRVLGRGGMGAVYEGVDLRLARQVAVKVLSGSMFGDLAALRRFEREARASARLSHPNIVQVYDYGRIGDTGAYLILELLHGHTLRQRMRRSGCLHPREAAQVFDQIFEGMKAAHASGVIHRDLKPENVVIVEGSNGARTAKILDFGLAKIHRPDGPASAGLTVPGTIMGTFGYMPPEQLSGSEVDARGDIYALAVMVVEAVTGKKPYAGRTWADLMAAAQRNTFRLDGDTPDVKRLEAILKKCLASNPNDRPPSISDLQDVLIPALTACRPLGTILEWANDTDSTKVYGDE